MQATTATRRHGRGEPPWKAAGVAAAYADADSTIWSVTDIRLSWPGGGPSPSGPSGGERATVGERRGPAPEARGSEMWFKATAASTQGRFSLMERTLPPGGRIAPHAHGGNDEVYFVLDGTVEFHVAGEVFDGAGGTFVLVPAGEAHTFGNTGEAPARLLVLHAPALDGYFGDLERLWAGEAPPDRRAEVDLMRRHGMEPA